MKSRVDTTSLRIQAASHRVKVDREGSPKLDREGRQTAHVTCVFWPEDDDPQVVRVTIPTAAVAQFKRGQRVDLPGLTIADYEIDGRRGFYYFADALTVERGTRDE